MDKINTDNLLQLTAQIVAAHVSKNEVPAKDLTSLIQAVHAALAGTSEPIASGPARPEPAVPIKRSVFPDYIVCLEDGKKLKMLRRYIQRVHGMTSDQYRERWGLPRDYPMVAPNYAERRSVLAKEIGLGRRVTKARSEPKREKRPAKKNRKPKAQVSANSAA